MSGGESRPPEPLIEVEVASSTSNETTRDLFTGRTAWFSETVERRIKHLWFMAGGLVETFDHADFIFCTSYEEMQKLTKRQQCHWTERGGGDSTICISGSNIDNSNPTTTSMMTNNKVPNHKSRYPVTSISPEWIVECSKVGHLLPIGRFIQVSLRILKTLDDYTHQFSRYCNNRY